MATAKFFQDRSYEILAAAGAQKIWRDPLEESKGGVHLLGTARMGNDAASSVVDKFHRTHDVPNLFLCDGSSFVTSGRGQPTMTIQALAFRAADHIAQFAKRNEILAPSAAFLFLARAFWVRLGRLAEFARMRGVFAFLARNLVIVKIAHQLGGAPLFHHTLQPSPGRFRSLRRAASLKIDVAHDVIDIDIVTSRRGIFSVFFLEFVGLGFLVHAFDAYE
jgi:hypothetical protein